MVLGLTNLRQIIIFSKGTVLAHQFKRAHKVIVTLDHIGQFACGQSLAAIRS